MGKRIFIKSKDKIITKDSSGKGGLRGRVIIGTGRKQVPYIDPFGNQSYRTKFDKVLSDEENIIPIGAYQFVFNKLFNIGLDQESTLRVGDLNDEAPQMKIGVQREEYKSIFYNAESSVGTDGGMPINSGINISALNHIYGFMIGDGGAREDNITVIAPNYKRRSLYHPIPFRMSNDGKPFPEGKYFGKVDSIKVGAADTISSYYVKKFDAPAPRIVHAWVTDNPDELSIVDDTVFASTSSMEIESYVEMNLSVSEYDCRGYFTSTNSTPRVNEIGLVTGWYNAEKNDYESIRIFSTFSRPSIALATGDFIEIIYRLYAR